MSAMDTQITYRGIMDKVRGFMADRIYLAPDVVLRFEQV